ncbi:hypothetical protein [Pseudoroseomonas cervicalis]|uniref:hypothetical protein n=1 Tax=Teichococcus cervicalis TaxID=204525 RepID=UPI0022F1BA31|nr:hypothetical protein [Pseudoroseomonas cervicalis]WBV44089.1 hypothetical protein PFY06_05860 [Pseudoroseomonas cervicalis]
MPDQPTAPAPQPEPGGAAADEMVRLFNALLDEIQLMIDHIASSNRKGLDRLGQGLRLPGAAQDATQREVLDFLAQLRLAPVVARAQDRGNLAFLMMLKDGLTRQVHPASGRSIAFTQMVVLLPGSRFCRRMGDGSPDKGVRASLAESAYPELRCQASAMKVFWLLFIGLLLIMVLWTASLSIYAENGRTMLNRLANATLRYQTHALALAVVEAQEGDQRRSDTPLTRPHPLLEVRAGGAARHEPPLYLSFCDRAKRLQELQDFTLRPDGRPGAFLPAYELALQARLCPPMWDAEREIEAARIRIEGFVQPHWLLLKWSWEDPLPPASAVPAPGKPGAAANHSVTEWRRQEWIADDLVGLLTRHILPLCFAVTGAAVSILRDMTQRMSEGRLSPHDLWRGISRVVLGVAVGLALGLFQDHWREVPQIGSVAAPGAGGPGLSSQALAFLAGYGLDSVFTFLDRQLLKLRQPEAAAPRQDGASPQQGPAPA